MKASTAPKHRKRQLTRVLLGSSTIFSIILMSAVDRASGQIRRVVFEGARSEHKWALKDVSPELPSDWSSFGYLVLEFRHSSPQRFYLEATPFNRRPRASEAGKPSYRLSDAF